MSAWTVASPFVHVTSLAEVSILPFGDGKS